MLLAADGVVAARVGVSKPTVVGWKKRYAAEGMGGLDDGPNPRRPRIIDELAILQATLEPLPAPLAVKLCRPGCWPSS